MSKWVDEEKKEGGPLGGRGKVRSQKSDLRFEKSEGRGRTSWGDGGGSQRSEVGWGGRWEKIGNWLDLGNNLLDVDGLDLVP